MAQNSVYQTYPQPFGALQYQYSNISVNISGRYFTFFNSVNYSDTNDVAEARGISPYPMGSTLGKIDSVRALQDVAYDLNISRELCFVVNILNSLPHTFNCRSDAGRSLAARILRASGATVTIPTSKDSPR